MSVTGRPNLCLRVEVWLLMLRAEVVVVTVAEFVEEVDKDAVAIEVLCPCGV